MMARLIGIIGKTHGVRFNASPPSRTSRNREWTSSLEQALLDDTFSALLDERQKVSVRDNRRWAEGGKGVEAATRILGVCEV